MSLIEGFSFDDKNSGYSGGGYFWKASTLYEAVKDQKCKEFKYPLKYLDMTDTRFNGCDRVCDVAYHMKRALNADLDIPIIFGPVGNIMDGFHRVVKALATDEKYIKAYRLKKLPPHDEEISK